MVKGSVRTKFQVPVTFGLLGILRHGYLKMGRTKLTWELAQNSAMMPIFRHINIEMTLKCQGNKVKIPFLNQGISK